MEYFLVRYDSRVVNYERKMFIRLATELRIFETIRQKLEFGKQVFGSGHAIK